MVTILSENFSLVNSWINELRNVETQTDRMKFRRNMERIGEIAAFEISKGLEQKELEITTPLDKIKVNEMEVTNGKGDFKKVPVYLTKVKVKKPSLN